MIPNTVSIEKKGGVTTPIRLFAVVKNSWGKTIAETEVVITNGVITKKV